MTEQMTAYGVEILIAAIVLFWLTVGALIGLHRVRKGRRSLQAGRRTP